MNVRYVWSLILILSLSMLLIPSSFCHRSEPAGGDDDHPEQVIPCSVGFYSGWEHWVSSLPLHSGRISMLLDKGEERRGMWQNGEVGFVSGCRKTLQSNSEPLKLTLSIPGQIHRTLFHTKTCQQNNDIIWRCWEQLLDEDSSRQVSWKEKKEKQTGQHLRIVKSSSLP